MIEQDESFFLAMVSPFEVDISAHTPDERLTVLGHRWWTLEELADTTDRIYPAELAILMRAVIDGDVTAPMELSGE